MVLDGPRWSWMALDDAGWSYEVLGGPRCSWVVLDGPRWS